MLKSFLKVYGIILIAECVHIFVVILYSHTASPIWGSAFVPGWKLQTALGGLAALIAYGTRQK